MLQPVRIEGARIPQPDPLAELESIPEAGSHIAYISPDGERYGLHYPTVAESNVQRVVMKPEGLEGATAQPEFTDYESVNGFGARQGSFKLPPVEVTTEVTITSDVQPVSMQEAEWRRAWSHFKDGRIEVRSRGVETRWAPARLVAMPDIGEELKGLRYFETSVTWRNMKGCWFGEMILLAGEVVLVPAGDLPPSLRLHWTGEASSVTFPDGRKVTFPELGAERYINLDFGMSAQVTRPDGTVDTNVWSGINGVVHGMTLAPNEPTEWVLGAGMTLEVTPRYLSPWR